jgi:hypothetical protein
MAERLLPLPEMQEQIDIITEAYGEDAIVTYTVDGTTCMILSPPQMDSSSVYLSIIEIDLPTHRVRVRELDIEPADLHTLLDWH